MCLIKPQCLNRPPRYLENHRALLQDVNESPPELPRKKVVCGNASSWLNLIQSLLELSSCVVCSGPRHNSGDSQKHHQEHWNIIFLGNFNFKKLILFYFSVINFVNIDPSLKVFFQGKQALQKANPTRR